MSDQALFNIPVTATDIRPGDVVLHEVGSGRPARVCGQCHKDVQVVCTGNTTGAGPTEGQRIVNFDWHRNGSHCGTCLTAFGGPRDPDHTWDRA